MLNNVKKKKLTQDKININYVVVSKVRFGINEGDVHVDIDRRAALS